MGDVDSRHVLRHERRSIIDNDTGIDDAIAQTFQQRIDVIVLIAAMVRAEVDVQINDAVLQPWDALRLRYPCRRVAGNAS